MKNVKLFRTPETMHAETGCEDLKAWLERQGGACTSEVISPASLKDVPVGAGETVIVRCHPQQGEEWLKECPTLPLVVQQTQTADFFFRRANDWHPELTFRAALHEALIRHGKQIELRGDVFVIGDGAALRAAASVAMEIGFRSFCFVGRDVTDLQAQAARLKRNYLSVNIRTIPYHEMTLQKISAALLINTVPLDAEPDLAADLAYFNFMLSSGVVVDLSEGESSKKVLEEADRAGLRVVPGHEVWELQRQVVRDLVKSLS